MMKRKNKSRRKFNLVEFRPRSIKNLQAHSKYSLVEIWARARLFVNLRYRKVTPDAAYDDQETTTSCRRPLCRGVERAWLREGREPALLDGPLARCIWRGACREVHLLREPGEAELKRQLQEKQQR